MQICIIGQLLQHEGCYVGTRDCRDNGVGPNALAAPIRAGACARYVSYVVKVDSCTSPKPGANLSLDDVEPVKNLAQVGTMARSSILAGGRLSNSSDSA
jgi:hypothetical protein